MKNDKNENWNTVKEHLKKEYPHLTEEDLACELGKEKELLQRLQKKVKINEHKIRGWLSLMG